MTAPAVVLVIASIAVFMAFLDDTVVGIAFPNMLASFHHASIAELSWVFNAYNIAFAACLVPAGRLADLLGRRRVFSFGVVLFTAASGACALAPSVLMLICARGVQGIGAAVIVPASLALVLEAYPASERTRAVGAWTATAALAAGIGPAIGGALVYAYDWRLVFVVNVPIGAAAALFSSRQLVESRAPGRRERPDLAGALVLAASCTALALAIAEGPVWGWDSPGVITAALIAVGGAGIFARRSRRHSAPVLDVELLRAPGFAVASVLTFVGAAGFLALGLANVLFLMQVWHYSALTTGLALTPAPLVAVPTAIAAGRLATNRHPRTFVSLGAVLLACGAVELIARMGTARDYLGAYLPGSVLLALGIGVAFPLVSDTSIAAAPRGRFAGATAVNNAIRLIGAALGVAVLAALVGGEGALDAPAPFRHAWAFAAICFAALAGVALRLPPSTASPVIEDGDDVPEVALASRPASGRRRSTAKPAVRADVRADAPEELISSVRLFAHLPPHLHDALASRTRDVRLSAREYLFREGEDADALYIVRSGRLEVLRRDAGAGHEEVIRELGPGSIVGELALISGERRSASVRCRRDAELLKLAREDCAAVLVAPEFASSVLPDLAAQLQRSAPLDATPVTAATTIAIVALTDTAERARVERALLRSLGAHSRVVHVDRDVAASLHPDASPGVALARTLDRLERDRELVLVLGDAADDAWTETCVHQSDRVLLVLSDVPARSAPLPAALRGCEVLLLQSASDPRVAALLDELAPRAIHRIAYPSFDSDVARLARRLTARSVGLVLSGGGARALAHVGVLEELDAAGITIDRIGGSSMGAFIAALAAHGMDVAEIDARCYEEWVRRRPLGDYRLPRHALIRGARLRAMLERNLEGFIEDLTRSYFCVSIDVVANELVVHRRGELATAVAASMAVPGVLPPVILGDRLLFDGAVLDGLPVSVMSSENEGPIIACDVTQRKLRERAPGEPLALPTLMDTLANLAFLGTSDTLQDARRHADLVITPQHEDVGALEFHMLDRLRDAGRRAAAAALEHAPAELFDSSPAR